MTKTAESVPATAFDIGAVDTVAASNKGMDIELLSPADQSKTGVFLTLLGKDSDVFRDAIREDVNATNRRAAMARQKGKQVPPKTMEDNEKESVQLLAACTLGWFTKPRKDDGSFGAAEPWLMVRGEKLPFNVPNAIRVYTDFLWIRKQADEAIGDIEAFLKA